MKTSKISVVTVCLNARDSIRLTMESVRLQSFGELEHVIIDGGSTDGTQHIVLEYEPGYFVSEPDGGVYDAMDKGAKAATGDILIFLNAGDTFYDDETCEEVAAFFEESGADIVFGNVMPVYLRPTDTHDHGAFAPGKLLDLGYVRERRQLYDESIHHQATFYRRWIFNCCTYACPSPEATGEYNLLLNAVMKHEAKVKHIPRPVSRFVLGGISTRDFKKEWVNYVKARNILRTMYFPSGKPPKDTDKSDFICESVTSLSTSPLTVSSSPKQRIKQLIKASPLFHVYERLAIGITTRIVNAFLPTLEMTAERQAQRIYHDVRYSVESNMQAYLKETLSCAEERKKGITELLQGITSTQAKTVQEITETLREITSTQVTTIQDIRQSNLSAEHGINLLNIETERLKYIIDKIRLNQYAIYSTCNNKEVFIENGFQVFSQWDEDGLIQYLISRIPNIIERFVEFGVGDYTEANSRLLLEKDNWCGLVIDSSADSVGKIRSSEYYWRHSLTAICAFVDRDNINQLMADNGFTDEIGILSIDVDGVDYWIWDAISVVSPQIVICEYNGAFGSQARVTVPYRPDFDRSQEHYSMVYAGASLGALEWLGRRKGYTLVGTNNGGNNAFFVRNDVMAKSGILVSDSPFTRPRFREARNPDGTLAFLDVADALRLVSDKPVIDVEFGKQILIADIPLSYE